MKNSNLYLFLAAFSMLIFASSCRQPIVLPEGVTVLIDGQTIEGEKVIEVSQGQDVRLQVYGLQSLSNVNFKIKKAGIQVYEDNFAVGEQGTVDEMISLPDISVQVTAVISFTDQSGVMQEMKFVIRLR